MATTTDLIAGTVEAPLVNFGTVAKDTKVRVEVPVVQGGATLRIWFQPHRPAKSDKPRIEEKGSGQPLSRPDIAVKKGDKGWAVAHPKVFTTIHITS